ncbi:unnamed protein product [Mytilus edulis]|uniref:Uncharacterized protein n=1 Tax=Mytilus edulis TaxID=6550 RepID=A0A8S3TMD9_MYTED|nr:unnamed protein product [Mytilus edulis]
MVDVDSGNCKSTCSNTVKNLQNIISKEQNEISGYLGSLICQKEKEFEILLIFSTLLRVKRVRPEDWISRVVFNRQAMACYMLLAYYTGTETNKESIIKPALRTAIAKGYKNIANIIHWFIIREYFRSCSFEIDYLIDIWPAVVCKRSNCYYHAFCSKDLVIMVQTTQSMENMPVKFWNIEIQYMRQAYGIDIEEKEKKLGYTNNDLSPSIENSFPELDGVLASDLFKKHSKLTLICKSVYKLKDGVKIEQPCIQLFCRGKDILEGGPVLARQVRVGEKINSRHHIGTLGGFVQILGDITLLTCAHVVLPEDNLNGINLTIPSNKAIYIDCEQTSASNNVPTSPTIHTKFRCGKLRYIEFRTDRPEETSIDAALINLQDDVKMDENDYIANRKDNRHHFSCLGMYI